MLTAHLNSYSLLVPIIMLSLGVTTLIIARAQGLAHYLSSYALALICIGITVFLNTVLAQSILMRYSSLIFFIYFISCTLHAQAIYERLSIQLLWPRCIYLIAIGCIGVYFFTQIHQNLPLRLLIIGLITSAIYLHRPILFFKTKMPFKIDHYLKLFTVSIVLIASFRAFLLAFFLDDLGFIGHYELVWSTTQLFLIIIDLIFLGIFITCAIFDVVFKLNQERNLDPLTGLLNRRGLNEHIQQLSHNSIKTHAVLMADLDHFKKINDRYGHPIGDLVLQHISQIFKYSIRDHDSVSRIGGEEFIVVLHDIHQNFALEIAERIRTNLENTPLIEEHHIIYLTVSIGISFFHDPNDIEDAFLAADHALYQAKRMGRNQIYST